MTDARSAQAAPVLTRLADYQPYPFQVADVHLTFELDPAATRVTQQAVLTRKSPASDPLELFGLNLELISLCIDDQPVDASRMHFDDERLTIRDVPDRFRLTVVTVINPEANTALEGLYLSNGMYCTQCEAEGFRRITYYPDRPDVMAVFTTEIIAPPGMTVALSNGNPVLTERTAAGGLRALWHDPFPKPCYLFALVAGDLALKTDRFVTASGREVELRIYVDPTDLDRVDYALESLKRAMAWDETAYGREYDLDIFMIVAVSHFNMGAMENKGLNIFNSSCVLASPDAATDQAFQRIEAIVAHEYFHNWSGNRVTCRDWFQLSLKEGFTVFRDSEFSAEINSAAVKRIQDVNFLRSAQFAEDAGPTAHPVQPDSYVEISNFYTLTIYEKGAEIVRMLKTLLGPELFRQGSDLYFARHDGQAVTIEAFVDAMATVSGRDLTAFMRWYRQPGTPILQVSTDWDPVTKELLINLTQHPPAVGSDESHRPYVIPVSYQVFDRNSGHMLQPEQLVTLDDVSAEVRCTMTTGDPVVSLLRGLSAPVKLDWVRCDSDLRAVALFDDDGVSRWDAMQTLYLQAIGASLEGDTGSIANLVQLVSELLASPQALADPAALAEMLMLPQDAVLWDRFAPADPQVLVNARKQVRSELARELSGEWDALIDQMHVTGPYRPDADAIGRRSLGIVALGYWARAVGSAADQRLIDMMHRAQNLTERFAAYRIARAEASAAVAATLSETFLEQAVNDEVLDLWLSTEAVDESTADLARVQALTEHPRFSWTNPNRVRSVIGAFAHRNVRAFHTAEGYRFLADVILRLDAMNPQLASRTVSPLGQWGRFTEPYRDLMVEQLDRLHSEQLSKDLFEIVDKSRRKM